jgi:hypothetical protein
MFGDPSLARGSSKKQAESGAFGGNLDKSVLDCKGQPVGTRKAGADASADER